MVVLGGGAFSYERGTPVVPSNVFYGEPSYTAGYRGMSGRENPALQATQGQMDAFFSQLPYKCHLFEVASVED